MYDVDLEVYQGPMDLLLELIRKNELDIYDIPIAFVTREFLKEMDQKSMDMNNLSSFLLMASTLLAIKSKMLLPKHQEEEEEEEDPRADLVQKLLEYKVYKEIAQDFKGREIEGSKVLTRLPQEWVSKTDAYLLQDLASQDLLEAFTELLARSQARANEGGIQPIYAERFKVSDCLMDLRQALVEKKKISFESLLSQEPTREEVISYFLGLLELAKTGGCHILYHAREKKIYIERREEVHD